MAQAISEVMTADPRTVEATATVADAAREMREGDVGPVIVTEEGGVCGIVTDRDITVRAVAEGKDPASTPVGEICSRNPTTLTPDQSVEEAIQIMRDQHVRRIPIVQDGRPAGIVAIGDLAVERDRESALADISAAPPTH